MGESDDSADDRDVCAAKKRRAFLNARTNRRNVARKSTGQQPASNQAGPSGSRGLDASTSEDSGDDFLNFSGQSCDNPRVLRSRNSRWTDHESDSGTETPDSDEMPVLEKTRNRTKKPAKRLPPAQKPSRAQKVQKIAKKSTLSVTPPKSSKTKKALSPKKNKEAFEQLVNKCVSYLLVADQKKYLIRKQAIVEHVFKGGNNQAGSVLLYKDVIGAAGKILKQIFGFELLSDKDQKDAYMIVNILKPELEVHEFSEYSRLKTQERGLLLVLLTVIFMNGNVIPEDELWVVLKPLGIDVTSRKPHPVFGDVKRLIGTEFVRQMYLESRSISKDPPQVEFLWGKRALQEVDKREILDFACKVMKDTHPRDWVLQHKEAWEAAEDRDEEN